MILFTSLRLVLNPCRPALPGLAPAGEVLSFASPKESTQRKGEPDSSALRCATGTLRCSGSAGSAETRPAGSNICASFSAAPCATRLLITAGGTEYQNQFNKDAPWRVLVGSGCSAVDFPHPCVCAEKRSGRRIKRRACLSAASLRGSRLARASQGAPLHSSGVIDTRVAFLLVPFLWRSKEKGLRRRAHIPACRPAKGATQKK